MQERRRLIISSSSEEEEESAESSGGESSSEEEQRKKKKKKKKWACVEYDGQGFRASQKGCCPDCEVREYEHQINVLVGDCTVVFAL